MKENKEYHTFGTFPKSNRGIVETDAKSIPYLLTFLGWRLGTAVSIKKKVAGKRALWAQPSSYNWIVFTNITICCVSSYS